MLPKRKILDSGNHLSIRYNLFAISQDFWI